MIENVILDRLALANKLTETTRYNQAMAAANPAITAIYVGTDPNLGLAKTITSDGGVGYQRQIYNGNLQIGDVVPATIQTGNAIGFIDGLNV